MVNELEYEDFYIARKIKNRMLKGMKKWSSRKTRNNIVPLWMQKSPSRIMNAFLKKRNVRREGIYTEKWGKIESSQKTKFKYEIEKNKPKFFSCKGEEPCPWIWKWNPDRRMKNTLKVSHWLANPGIHAEEKCESNFRKESKSESKTIPLECVQNAHRSLKYHRKEIIPENLLSK